MLSLLDLPQEIRNQIWTCVLYADESEASFWGAHECKLCRWISLRRGYKYEVAVLLLANKQVHSDTRNLPVQHAESIGFRHPGCFQRWTRRASMHDLSNIRRIILKYEREAFMVSHGQWGAGRIREEILASLQTRFATVHIQGFDYTTLRHEGMRSRYPYHWSRTNPAIEDYALSAEILVSQPQPPLATKAKPQQHDQASVRPETHTQVTHRGSRVVALPGSESLLQTVISTVVRATIFQSRLISRCIRAIGIDTMSFATRVWQWLWSHAPLGTTRNNYLAQY